WGPPLAGARPRAPPGGIPAAGWDLLSPPPPPPGAGGGGRAPPFSRCPVLGRADRQRRRPDSRRDSRFSGGEVRARSRNARRGGQWKALFAGDPPGRDPEHPLETDRADRRKRRRLRDGPPRLPRRAAVPPCRKGAPPAAA